MKRENLDFSASMTDKIVGMKFGVPKEYLSEGLNPEVKEAFMNTLKSLTEMGAVVEFFSMKTTEYMILPTTSLPAQRPAPIWSALTV